MRYSAVAARLSVLLLLVMMEGSLVSMPAPAYAREFDITGTLDCGAVSGHKCTFSDWDTGPVIGVFTEDISGTRQRVLIDTSWVKKSMDDFGQDDFVWFTVWDGIGEHPVVVSVVEHRCQDGRYPHGQVAHGLSTSDFCKMPG